MATQPPKPIKIEIDRFLAEKQKSLIEIYFDVQKFCEEKFGEQTLVLIEVGSFFEIYGVDNEKEQWGKPKKVAEILNLQLTKRNKTIPENSVENPLLAGFPVAAFDRYIQRLIQENIYTVVVIRQKGVPPQITRYLDCILSPGVHFEYATFEQENFVVSLLLDKNKNRYSAGYSAVDVVTGKVYVSEIHGTAEDPTFALDEVYGLLQAHHSAEILINCITHDMSEQEIIQYLELGEHAHIRIQDSRFSIQHQNALFKQMYSIQSMLSPIEFLDLERMPLASESFAHLLSFVVEHDDALTRSLNRPTILTSKQFLYLGNNPLEQLNVISKDPDDLTVLHDMDYTITCMGKRLLHERLVHPITDKQELEKRYNLVDTIQPLTEQVDVQLKNMYDLERIVRRIQLVRLHPFELNFLHDSLVAIQHIIEIIKDDASSTELLSSCSKNQISITRYLSSLEQIFNLNETTKVSMQEINGAIFQKGFHSELDELIQQQKMYEAQLDSIRKKILDILCAHTKKDEPEYVQIKQLDKEGHYIHLTKNRYSLIQYALKESMVSIDGTVYAFNDFHYTVQTSNVKITADIIDKISSNIIVLQLKIAALAKELYLSELHKIDVEFSGTLKQLIQHIAQIDVAVSTVKASQMLHLVRPEIVETTQKENILELIQVRHLLVEAREENGIYVPNDVVMGDRKYTAHTEDVLSRFSRDDIHGVLLYGINSSGKSSLMKSIGICILLAQAGFFVPAAHMRFSLCTELFTRIVARDNFEKGLSSFAVEMMELKNILNRCSSRSIILGDEISHGTELFSALAILSATILRLSEVGALFLLATHLHQLQTIESIRTLSDVVSVHLSVHYDEKNDTLIFDRLLQEGSGNSIYGLEFAQSLHIDEHFLNTARSIRQQLVENFEQIDRQTRRNKHCSSIALQAQCAICQKRVDDMHHIRPKHLADECGFIEHVPKDHQYNLIPLCKQCHKKVHAGRLLIRGFVMTNNGLALQFEEKQI
ncbi:MAG TPA: DNA mismatch repair protein [Patescibacteria group bacterium]|nr:DNA mismatch repair protein [Patescibacteria group bacterium]